MQYDRSIKTLFAHQITDAPLWLRHQRLQRLRTTQQDVARLMGLSVRSIESLEIGVHQNRRHLVMFDLIVRRYEMEGTIVPCRQVRQEGLQESLRWFRETTGLRYPEIAKHIQVSHEALWRWRTLRWRCPEYVLRGIAALLAGQTRPSEFPSPLPTSIPVQAYRDRDVRRKHRRHLPDGNGEETGA